MNQENGFKVGDHVISLYHLTKGETGVVVELYDGGYVVDGFSDGSKHGDYYAYDESFLELVKPGTADDFNKLCHKTYGN